MKHLEQPTLLDHYQKQSDKIIRQVIDEVCDFREFCADINLALVLGTNLQDVIHLVHLIHPPFDPLRTIGKYEK
jgi:hypothetical protein